MKPATPNKPGHKPVLAVKVPTEVRDWLKTKAAQGYRSMSAQALLIIDAARKQDGKQEKEPA